MTQPANDHSGDRHVPWRQARVDSESGSASTPLAQGSQTSPPRQAQDEAAGFSAEAGSAESVGGLRPEMGTVTEAEQRRVAELIAAADIRAQFAARETDGATLGRLDVHPSVVEEMLRVVQEAFPAPPESVEGEEEGEEGEEEEGGEGPAEEASAHSGSVHEAPAPGVEDSGPAHQVAGVLFAGPGGSAQPVRLFSGAGPEREPLDPARRGTREISVPEIPSMQHHDVEELLRGGSERASAMCAYDFPKPPPTARIPSPATAVPKSAGKMSRVKSLRDKLRFHRKNDNKQAAEPESATPPPRHKPLVPEQPLGPMDAPNTSESYVHEEYYGRPMRESQHAASYNDTTVRHARFAEEIGTQSTRTQTEMQQQDLPHSGNREKLFGPRGVLGRPNWQDGPPARPIRKQSSVKALSALDRLGSLAAQFIKIRKEASSEPGYLRRLGGKIWKSLRSPLHRDERSPSPQPTSEQGMGEEEATVNRSSEPCGDATISIEPRVQADIISRLEVGLNETANDFLLQGKDQGCVSLESVRRVVQDWKKKNRPLPHDFMFDFKTQCELIAANVDTLTFHRVGNDHLNRLAMISAFRGLSRELESRTYCLPDLALKKLMVDGFRVMEMLGADAGKFVQLQQSQMYLNDVIVGRERQQEEAAQQRRDYGVTRRVESPLLISSRGIIDDEDEYYNDGIYKGGPHAPAEQDNHTAPDASR